MKLLYKKGYNIYAVYKRQIKRTIRRAAQGGDIHFTIYGIFVIILSEYERLYKAKFP